MVWMNCTVLTFLRYFFLCLKLWFECCDFLARFFCCLDGFSSWLWMGGFFLVSFNFLGAMFSCISLASATSSYADDIAYIKILYEQKPMWFFTAARTGCSFLFPFLGLYWLFVAFDWNFLDNGICYLRCKWDILIYRWCFGLFYLLLISGVRDICKITAL